MAGLNLIIYDTQVFLKLVARKHFSTWVLVVEFVTGTHFVVKQKRILISTVRCQMRIDARTREEF